jgi:hypothetical protein
MIQMIFVINYEAEVLFPDDATKDLTFEDFTKWKTKLMDDTDLTIDNHALRWAPGKDICVDCRRSRSKIRDEIIRLNSCSMIRNIRINDIPIENYDKAVAETKGKITPTIYGKIVDYVFCSGKITGNPGKSEPPEKDLNTTKA